MNDFWLKTDYKFDVKVLSLVELEKLIFNVETSRFPNIISIGDPGIPIPSILSTEGRNVLRIEYDDIYLDNAFSVNKQPPTEKNVLDLFQFAYDCKDSDAILVHCQNGISRSPAVGLILLYLKEKSEKTAAEKLFEVRPISMPDRYFVQIADKLLESHLKEVSEEIVLNRIVSIQDRVNDSLKKLDELL